MTEADKLRADPTFSTLEALDAWLEVAYGLSATAELVGGPSYAQHVLNQAQQVEAAHAHLKGQQNDESS